MIISMTSPGKVRVRRYASTLTMVSVTVAGVAGMNINVLSLNVENSVMVCTFVICGKTTNITGHY